MFLPVTTNNNITIVVITVYVKIDVTRLTAVVPGIFAVSVMGVFVRCQRDKSN